MENKKRSFFQANNTVELNPNMLATCFKSKGDFRHYFDEYLQVSSKLVQPTNTSFSYSSTPHL